jgi:hypothetical protein
MWEIGDKLLITEREKKKLEEELSKQQILLRCIGTQVIQVPVKFFAEDVGFG